MGCISPMEVMRMVAWRLILVEVLVDMEDEEVQVGTLPVRRYLIIEEG